MELSDLLIRIIILLLPGLLCISLIKLLISKRKIENREYIVYTIILSFSCYTVLYFFSHIFKSITKVTFFQALLDSNIAVDFHEVFYASIIAVVLGIILTIIINKGSFYNLFRTLKISNRTCSVSVWEEFVNYNGNGINNYVYVVDIDNDEIYGGQILNYSVEDNGYIELVLIDVVVTKNSKREEILREMDKIYLSLPKEKIYIEVGEAVNGKENRKKRSKPKNIKTK